MNNKRPLINSYELADIEQLVRANNENFPVGSRLISPDCRPHVLAFYLFARKADDIADSEDISADEKIKSLKNVQFALGSDQSTLPDWALPYNKSLIETGNTSKNGKDLLSAFIQDVKKNRYATWEELMDYCTLSAASVGRAMIDIHGESKADIEGADALCRALQVLNHLQDFKKDFLKLDRIYIPNLWLESEGSSVEHLSRNQTSESLRRVINLCLTETDKLLVRAEKMPKSLNRRRFRIEISIILELAKRLSSRLRVEDPLSYNVKLSKFNWFTTNW